MNFKQLLETHEEALDLMTTTIHGVKQDAWNYQSPCTQWSVHDVVNHITGENLWVEPLLDGKTIEQVGDEFEGDVLGSDPVAAWDQAAKNSAVAYANTKEDQTVNVSWGQITATEYLQQLICDLTIHSWDIARGSKQDIEIPDHLAELAFGITRPMVENGFTTSVFAPPVKVDASADAQTRLLALTGRDPNWSS